ncbi:beta-mannosidase [Kineothrix sp. MB12-C1]|uniref:beta-mannosidase n=1 Tax=Kineothrix sp. MB12-C1 TaxID=3070215 RepID=UPI0027D1F324|nr:glycoside hydrolase family 2 protein [Kineothrix sp. MB12-C1]WMC92983.1 glycoside hydrolase family 2 protein [Kineothrix sp. MB12-C1]
MEKQQLKTGWKLVWNDKLLETEVPCSVYSDLLKHGEIEEPFYRYNEEAALPLSERDYVYKLCFDAEEGLFQCGKIWLCFQGVDTLADIFLNGVFLGKTFNMHREWEFPVESILREKENLLEVHLFSPIRYMEEQIEVHGAIPCNTDTLDGFPYLRKSSCMSGWDWAPKLPDMGIFRQVFLNGTDKVRIADVHIRQEHEKEKVRLSLHVDMEKLEEKAVCDYRVTIIAPDRSTAIWEGSPESIEITKPSLWWPRGYGKQDLYTVKVEAVADGDVVDIWQRRIGLRTMTMKIEKDAWGESFAHEVNGIAVFAMGADYIPEDCLLPRVSEETTRKLLEQCALANYNAIRVWGGAYYPDDWFYDACDELGLLVWQDFMFACATYLLTEEFEENISWEIIQNVRRIRHHACLGLWCGNNEMEDMLLGGYCENHSKTQRLLGDYTRMYSYIIPRLVKAEDPDTFYWPSSPSSGGDFDNPQDETRGDAHYWQVWHGYKPFPDYRKHNFRYASEFGFEAMPSLKTIEAFTLPEDRNVFSYVMERHQRSENGYAKMMVYISQYFKYPKDFSTLIYASQLMQGQAMRYAVEHWRRHRGECMGAIVWQLNDCWPVTSWSSIDYFGRWKALHYFEKRFFAPVMISCCEEGLLTQNPNINARPYAVEKSIRLNVANETREDRKVTVRYSLRDNHSCIIGEEKEEEIMVPALTSVWLVKEELPHARLKKDHLSYLCMQGEEIISEGSVIFSMPKFYDYVNPELKVRTEGDEVVVTAKAYAASVELLNEEEDWVLSDNYFDMEAGEKRVKILSGTPNGIKVRSIYDIA